MPRFRKKPVSMLMKISRSTILSILPIGMYWVAFYYGHVFRVDVWGERHWYDTPYNITALALVFGFLICAVWSWVDTLSD